jgi:hypothetical protein
MCLQGFGQSGAGLEAWCYGRFGGGRILGLVVFVLVLEVMKTGSCGVEGHEERSRVIVRVDMAVGMCRRKGKVEHRVGGGRVLVLVVFVLMSKGMRNCPEEKY